MKDRALPADYLAGMAGVLRTLGHAFRLQIVERLDRRGPAPGHRLLRELGGAQGALSQHLSKLRLTGVIRAERRGREIWYGLASPDARTILDCMRHRRKRRGAGPPRRFGRLGGVAAAKDNQL